MLDDVNRLFEWAVANRLNKIEWLLLGHRSWGDELETRMNRFQIMTDLAHQYSLMVGADCPLGNIQQHGWYIVNTRLPFLDQIQQIRDRVDYVFNSGFDFMTTESGLSEFTHPECSLMLDLLNAFAEYVNRTWGREAGVKVHCSTGQVCDDYLDPRDNKPINFNFLTLFASPELGVFPHTVQTYGFDDHTAGAYGNDDFRRIEDYLVYEAKSGRRAVSYYGETAYWVNVDIDVPLLLPLTPQRRLRDLRKIARREKAEGFRMQGQINFDSGWEWGYWMNDVVTARGTLYNKLNAIIRIKYVASWDPKMNIDGDWEAFYASLDIFRNVFGEKSGTEIAGVVARLAQAQEELLINGIVNGNSSPNIYKLNGFGYLMGSGKQID